GPSREEGRWTRRHHRDEDPVHAPCHGRSAHLRGAVHQEGAVDLVHGEPPDQSRRQTRRTRHRNMEDAMKDTAAAGFSTALLSEIRDRFAHVDTCPFEGERVFFENAGGALTLKSVVETSAKMAAIPDNQG